MIVWLSSFPRSGNTFLRLMLKRVWNINTYSMYDDRADIGANAAIAQRVGHRFLASNFSQAYQAMLRSDELFCVKTHDIPIDSSKTIYIVRDGRAASVSYWHYQQDFPPHARRTTTLADVIVGFTPYGSWSHHLDAWNPLQRADTLLVHYEQLLLNPGAQINRVADFLERPPLKCWRNDFDELHQLDPRFFRTGRAGVEDDLSPDDLDLFDQLHGEWLARLEYAPGRSHSAGPGARHQIYTAIAQHQGYVNHLQRQLAKSEAERSRLSAELRAMADRLEHAQASTSFMHPRLENAENRLKSMTRSRLVRAYYALRSHRFIGRAQPTTP